MESSVIVVISRSSHVTTKQIQTDKPPNRLLPTGGIEEVRTHIPFRILVINFSKKPVNLPKNILIAVSTQLPEMIIVYEMLKSSSKRDVTTVHYNGSEDRWTQMERYPQVATEDKGRKTHDLRQEITIDGKFLGHRKKILEMMEQFKSM